MDLLWQLVSVSPELSPFQGCCAVLTSCYSYSRHHQNETHPLVAVFPILGDCLPGPLQCRCRSMAESLASQLVHLGWVYVPPFTLDTGLKLVGQFVCSWLLADCFVTCKPHLALPTTGCTEWAYLTGRVSMVYVLQWNLQIMDMFGTSRFIFIERLSSAVVLSSEV